MTGKRFPLVAAIVAVPLMVMATSCIITLSFWEGTDASGQFDWEIDNGTHTCADVDGSQVRMSVSEGDGAWEWWDDFYWPCSAGAGDTGYVFATGSYYFAWQLIDSSNSAISQTDWHEHSVTTGTNPLANINFLTDVVPAGPTVQWSWTIEGHEYEETLYESLCPWATGDTTTIIMWVDTDADGVEDDTWTAECGWGAAQVEADSSGYTVGQTIDVWFALIDSAGDAWSESADWATFTLTDGLNDLGEVDFDLGPYGPLDVTLQFWDKETDPALGDCDNPPGVETIGYLLSYSTGEVADVVDIDTDPMTCVSELSWLETDFDTYVLELDGLNATDGYEWGSTCIDLLVDDETANAFACEVIMTVSP